MFSDNKNKLILILVIILAFSIVFLAYAIYTNSDANSINNSNLASGDFESLYSNLSFTDGPTDEAKIDSSNIGSKLLGENDLGTVELFGPFGNPDSDIRIAYSIGMHPYESKVHRALFDTMVFKNSSLNYCYYIYKINVTNPNLDDEGRMSGQLLAQEFVAPHIINGSYDLFVDVHSNKGTVGGTYEKTNFIFAVGQDEKSEVFVRALLNELPELEYYFPAAQSSPPYITLPVEEAGTPTINYETFSYENISTTYKLVNNLTDKIDNLDFNSLK